MEAQMIYPTAPADMHHPASDAASPRAHHTEGAQHVESSGKPEGMMSKVKRKAKKLKDKIKKSAGSDSTDNDHGDINMRDQEDMLHQHAPDEELDEGAESCEDDEEDHDHMNPDDKQFQYQQLRSIGALGNQEEVEVHGGIPVSALAAAPDTYGKSAADDVPISPYKNGGPPDTLQATPTEYRNYAADNDPLPQLGGEGKKTDVNVDRTTDSLGLPAFAEVKTSKSPAELHAEVGVSGNSADMDVAYPEDIVKPNPQFGHPTSATYDKIGVMNEDLSTDRKLGVGHTLEDSSGRGKENLLETSVPEFAELSGYDQSSAPASVGADELVYRPVSDPDEGSLLTHPPGILDGVVHELNEIAQAAETGQPNSNTPAFLSDGGEYSSTRGEEKPVFDNADKSLSSEPSPHEEAAESDKNQYESWSKWSADKQDKVKDEGSFPTSAPGTVVGAISEPNAVLQAYGTGESLDDRTSSFAKETGDPSTSVEERLISDATNGVENLPLEQSAHTETAEPEKNQQERWGEFSANKLSNAKAVGTTGEGEPPRSGTDGLSNNLIDAVAIRVDGGGAPNLQNDEYVDALSKGRVISEDVRKDLDDDEFYDPNDVKDSQFQEGFALGSGDAEEDALNSTLAGSAIGKLQGLKETVASTLGYGNTASPHTAEGGGNGEENPRGDVNISPTQQQTGFVKGWKDTVASTFGYGKELTDEASHRGEDARSHVAEKEHKPEVGIDGSEQQIGGSLQGLKNVVVSKLGYGTGGELHSPSEHTRSHNTPVEDAQPRYDDEGEHGVRKGAHISGESALTEGESQNQQQTGVFQGMRNMVTSKLGFGAEGPHTTEMGHMTRDEGPAVASEERAGDNHQADGYTQKLFNTTAVARDYLSSKIGYGNSDQGKDDRDLAYAGEGEKPINPSIDNYNVEGRQRV